MVVSLGRFYEERVRSQATDLLETVTAARVESATRVTDSGPVTVPIAELDPGDRVRVTPGERVPIDGTVIEGTADLDESVITGESLPVRKGPGETVIGGATLLSEVDEEAGENEVDGGDSAGAIVMQVGEDAESTADRLAAALWEVQTATPGIQRFVDKLATVFVPVVLTLGAIVAGWRLATGNGRRGDARRTDRARRLVSVRDGTRDSARRLGRAARRARSRRGRHGRLGVRGRPGGGDDRVR